MSNIAIENGYRNIDFSHEKMVNFHTCVCQRVVCCIVCLSEEKHTIHKTLKHILKNVEEQSKNVEEPRYRNWFRKRKRYINQSSDAFAVPTCFVTTCGQAFGCKAEKAPDRPSEETDQIVEHESAFVTIQFWRENAQNN